MKSLLIFLTVVVGGGIAIGTITAPGPWYVELAKPSFNPPNWIFGPAWSLLYVLIAIAGWRVWKHEPGGLAMKIWWAQLLLNFTWSPTFFSAQNIELAFAIIILLLVSIVVFIATTWRISKLAAFLFLPYAAWVTFASVLNGAIMILNG